MRAYGTSAVGLAAAAAAAMPSTVATHAGACALRIINDSIFTDAIDTDPRELERFAEHFKQRRIKLGVTQVGIATIMRWV